MSDKILLIEPFYGGSHKQLIDLIHNETNSLLYTLTPKKFHWRSRTSALYLSHVIPPIGNDYGTLFVSSVLNLSEIVSLRPDIAKLHKIIYFHENQIVYPVREQKERDFQYGYNQILSCIVADTVIFNSYFNMNSFVNGIKKFLRMMPDYRPTDVIEKFINKCRVIYFPIVFPYEIKSNFKVNRSNECLHILWSHRWEHDKGPDQFFSVLFQLKEENVPFKLSVIGESFTDNPEIFQKAKELLNSEIVNWGFVESKSDYWRVLQSCHIVVSTAIHEFFGVAMLEASYCGCYPLCPNRLVYSEIFPRECLYENISELKRKIKHLQMNLKNIPEVEIEYNKYDWRILKDEYLKLLNQKSSEDTN